MEKFRKQFDNLNNGNNTGNYPYNGEKISQADLGTSEVSVNDPRIINRKDVLTQDQENLDNAEKCNVTNVVDESYRIDENSNYSTTALEENACIDEPLIPGMRAHKQDLKNNFNKEEDSVKNHSFDVYENDVEPCSCNQDERIFSDEKLENLDINE